MYKRQAYASLQGAIRGVNSLYETQRRFQAAENRLKIAFDGDIEKAGRELKFMRQEADRLGVNFETLTEQYTKFLFAANKANLTQEQSRQIFRGVTETAVANRLSNEELALSYRAVIQIMSKGKVQAEELRNQLGDHIPGAVQIMAAALGKSTQELDKMMEQGQLTAETLIDLANEMRFQVQGVLPQATKSLTAEVGRFQNAWTDLKREINSSGLQEVMRETLVSLTRALKSADVKKLARDFVSLADAIGRLIRVVADNLPAVLTGIQALAGYKLLAGLSRLLGIFKGVKGELTQVVHFTKMLPLQLAAVAAGGYSLGTILRQNFKEVEAFGVALVTGALEWAEIIKGAWEKVWESIKLVMTRLTDGMKGKIADFAEALSTVSDSLGLEELANRYALAADMLRQGISPSKTFADVWGEIDEKTAAALENIQQIRQIQFDKILSRDKPAIPTVPEVSPGSAAPVASGFVAPIATQDQTTLSRLLEIFKANRQKINELEATSLADRLNIIKTGYSKIKADISKTEAAFQKQLAELIEARNTPGLSADQMEALSHRIEEARKALAELSRGRIEAEKLFSLDKGRQEKVVSHFIRETLQTIDASIAETAGAATEQQFALIREKFGALQAEIVDFAAPVQRLRVFQDEITRIGAIQSSQVQQINAQRSAGVITERAQVLAIRQANESYQEQLRILAEIAKTQGFEFISQQILRTADAVKTTSSDVQVLGEEINRNLATGFTDAFESFLKGTKSAKNAFRAFAVDFLRQIAQMILQKQILASIGGGGIGGAIAGVVAHTGGIAGKSPLPSRTVPDWVFAGARRLHTGTFPGLKPNEVPAILEKGEGVFTEEQMAAMGGNQGGQDAGSFRFVFVDDQRDIGNWITSSTGEKTFIQLVERNKSSIRRIVNAG